MDAFAMGGGVGRAVHAHTEDVGTAGVLVGLGAEGSDGVGFPDGMRRPARADAQGRIRPQARVDVGGQHSVDVFLEAQPEGRVVRLRPVQR